MTFGPVTILHAGAVAILDGGVALVGWSVDTGGRGPMTECIGEVLIAARDHINAAFDDALVTLPEDKFDKKRIADASNVLDKLLGRDSDA